MNPARIVSKINGEYYQWGDHCSGWHLVQSANLSIIEESMPPGTQEIMHFHNFSEQFFYVLKGTATFLFEREKIEIEQGFGLNIQPQVKHQIRNENETALEFLVVSQPTTQGDRINAPFKKEMD